MGIAQEIDVIIRIMPNGDSVEVDLALDATGNDIIANLLNHTDIKVPIVEPGTGDAYVYELVVKSKNAKLDANETLEKAGLQSGDIILMIPKLVAG